MNKLNCSLNQSIYLDVNNVDKASCYIKEININISTQITITNALKVVPNRLCLVHNLLVLLIVKGDYPLISRHSLWFCS